MNCPCACSGLELPVWICLRYIKKSENIWFFEKQNGTYHKLRPSDLLEKCPTCGGGPIKWSGIRNKRQSMTIETLRCNRQGFGRCDYFNARRRTEDRMKACIEAEQLALLQQLSQNEREASAHDASDPFPPSSSPKKRARTDQFKEHAAKARKSNESIAEIPRVLSDDVDNLNASKINQLASVVEEINTERPNPTEHIVTARNCHTIAIFDRERGTISTGALADADDSNSSAMRTLPKATTQLVQNADEDGSARTSNSSGYLDVSGCLVRNKKQSTSTTLLSIEDLMETDQKHIFKM